MKQLILTLSVLFVLLLPATGRAQCTPIPNSSLPFSEDFDNLPMGAFQTDNNCWHVLGYFSSTAHVTCTNQYDGTTGNALKLDALNAVSGCHWLVFPPVEDVHNTVLSFYARMSYSYIPIQVGVMTNPTDTSTFIPIRSFDTSLYAFWVPIETSMASYTGTGHYIAIRPRPNDFARGYVYIDNIVVSQAACSVPCCLSVSDYVGDSVTLSWQIDGDANQFIIDVPGLCNDTVNGTSYTITGLSYDREYTVNLRTLCTTDTVSDVYRSTFRTPVTSMPLPYLLSFDSVTLPEGCMPLGNAALRLDTVNYVDAPASLEFLDSDLNNILVLPQFTSEVADLCIDLFVRHSADGSWGWGSLQVGYVTDPYSPASFVALQSYNIFNTYNPGFIHVHQTFAGAPEGSRIAVRHYAETNYGHWEIDRIRVSSVSCPPPVLLTSLRVGSNTATIRWQTLSTSDTWLVALNGDTASVTDTFYTFTGLNADTAYIASVAHLCGSDTSGWVDALIRTRCPLITSADLPYIEDFSGYTLGFGQPIDPCWTRFKFSETGSMSTNSTPSPYNLNGEEVLAVGYMGSAREYVILPEADSISHLSLSFRTNTIYLDKKYFVGVMVDPWNFETFTTLDTVTPTVAATWESWRIPLSEYNDLGGHVAIRVEGLPNSYGSPRGFGLGYIDDITLADTGWALPDTIPIPPDTIPLPPDTIPFPPDTIPLPPDTIPLPPDTIPLPPDTIPTPPDTSVVGLCIVDGMSVKVYSHVGSIIVDGAANKPVAVYDLMGRIVAIKESRLDRLTFRLPVGTYLVRIGDGPARRVAILR